MTNRFPGEAGPGNSFSGDHTSDYNAVLKQALLEPPAAKDTSSSMKGSCLTEELEPTAETAENGHSCQITKKRVVCVVVGSPSKQCQVQHPINRQSLLFPSLSQLAICDGFVNGSTLKRFEVPF
jgi:hypothetical protein